MESENNCEHFNTIKELKVASDHSCEECLKTGSTWVHLRTCQSCGMTLCCDQSANTHMTKHFHATGHPVVISSEYGEKWLWCYIDETYAEYQ